MWLSVPVGVSSNNPDLGAGLAALLEMVGTSNYPTLLSARHVTVDNRGVSVIERSGRNAPPLFGLTVADMEAIASALEGYHSTVQDAPEDHGVTCDRVEELRGMFERSAQ